MSQLKSYQNSIWTLPWKIKVVRFFKSPSLPIVKRDILDQSSFAELYTAYLPRIFNYVSYRVMDRDLAEELTSAIFERALKNIHTYRKDKGAFSTWLFTIAHNTVTSHFRTVQKHTSWLMVHRQNCD